MSITNKFYEVLTECSINRNYSLIYDFLRECSKKILFEKDKKELVRLIPEIVEHSTRHNINWLNIEKLRSYPGYYDALKEGLYTCNPYDNGLTYSAFLFRIDKKDFFDKEFVEYLATRDLYRKDVVEIVKNICMEKPELTNNFLDHLRIELDEPLCLDLVDAIYSGCFWGSTSNEFPVLDENLDRFINHIDNLYSLYANMHMGKSREKVKRKIVDNIEQVIPNIPPKYITSVIRMCDDKEQREKAIKYASDHFDEIVESYSPGFMFDLFAKEIKGISILEAKRDEYVNNNFDKLVESIYYSMNDITKEDVRRLEHNPDREAIIDIIRMVFEEVCENENVRFSDIRRIGRGSYTDVFQVGEKVVKVGTCRGNSKFPNNPYIITPLLRKDFGIKIGRNYENAYIEVTERVDIIEEGQIGDEELYSLYSRMREIGLEWMDIQTRNVGLLRRDNRIYWKDQLEPSDEVLGLGPKVGAGVHLKKGDLVILDADFIYEEGSIPYEITHPKEGERCTFLNKWKKFHERYNQEHYYGGHTKKM